MFEDCHTTYNETETLPVSFFDQAKSENVFFSGVFLCPDTAVPANCGQNVNFMMHLILADN